MMTSMLSVVALSLAAFSSLVLGSSEPQREAMLFAEADQDQDGMLTKDDLHNIFLSFDTNKDNDITQDEFVTDWTTVNHLGNADEARTLFGKADGNKDGVITEVDLTPIYSYFDMDGNNLVDLNEFLTQWHDLRLDAPDTIVINPNGNDN